MILLALLATPLVGAALLMRLPARAALTAHGACATATTVLAVLVAAETLGGDPVQALGGLLRADALSGWMTGLIGLTAGLVAIEAPAHAARAPRRFYPLLHALVFTMLLAVTTDDVVLMWAAIEGATLACAFLITVDRTRRSVEAGYRYLLICSVGVALAFVGTVAVSLGDIHQFGDMGHALRWTTLRDLGPQISAPVMGLAFAFLLVGYGTIAAVVPMHTWLPDAHSEAPAPVSALMSGVVVSVAIYAVLRFKTLVDLAAGPTVARHLLLLLAIASLAVAAARLWTSTSYPRMLAHSSIGHIGIVCLGLAFGGAWGTGGALLHMANHALAQSVLGLLSGRIRAAYGSAEIGDVRGLLTALPDAGRAFLAAILALMGLPPFGLFVSELMIMGAGFRAGYWGITVVSLALLVVASGGLLRSTQRMLYGEPGRSIRIAGTPWPPALPVAAALALLVLTGLAWPPGLAGALQRMVAVLGP